jgi:outer membrane receptor protein involved in Fe transport
MENVNGGQPEGFACLNDPVFGTGYSGCKVPLQYYEYHTNPERWSNELRLASKPGGRFHWSVGGYWEKTRDKNSGSTYYMPGLQTQGVQFQTYNSYYSTPPGSTSLPPGVWYAYTTRSDYLQTTEFANINFDITKKLNIEAGTVHFHSDFTYYSPYGQFSYQPTSPTLIQGSSHKWNSRFGLNYHVTDHVMLYADFAQGFRDGGANDVPVGCYARGVPHSYTPDTLDNYEIGWKSTGLNGRLLWDGALYTMPWSNLQTLIYDLNICPTSSYNANVGNAHVYGMESNLSWRANDNWTVQLAGSYNDSHLTSVPPDPAFTLFRANIGERLPYVPYFNYSAAARYEQPVAPALKGYLQFDLSHKGDMWNDLHVSGSNGFPRMLQPAYTLLNLRLGLNPEGGRWLAELYVTNLTDKNAIVYTNTGNFDLRETTNEPRVYGLRVNYRFGKETNSE